MENLFFLVSLLGFTLFLIASFLTLPPYSHSQNSYRNIILADDPVHIKAANAVAAVAFDYRCFDSFVEAIILFTTVAGIMLLLRKGKGEKEEYSLQKRIKKTISTRSSATATMGWALLGFVALFGFI
ncbi:hypothetical protein Loa_01688 [Legionella oakridgensis ATCC 33761 = DSM 21215]|uniref:Multisubunit Na+/H+ antiporter, MnhB subunit n=1 Tax=Legionella oakridgensis ATCC 33761 = DSM 21215 TaxID=1268635 RepID=W0BBJ9_9GAMM|nr:hypothetical protein [Legionella oakridgensis]AHE67235.1 hypothetical protein Loa_01688 [Legionella oakridgensis ATCC 33761 = DSM 21215]